ncbi:MAG: enterotoxin [Terracidiphilus sp.]
MNRNLKQNGSNARSQGFKALVVFSMLAPWCVSSHGQAAAQTNFVLRDARLMARFEIVHGGLRIAGIEDLRSGAVLRPDQLFRLRFADGSMIAASQTRLTSAPAEMAIAPKPAASRLAERLPGRELCADLSLEEHGLAAHWCAILRNGTNYLRQEVTLKARAKAVPIAKIQLFDFDDPNARVAGTAKGSPLVAGDFFFGFESPLAESRVMDGRATSELDRVLPLRAGNSITYSSVIGVAAPGQMRRDFLAYLEDERAHPYRTFLHYNTWYDLGGHYTEAQALDRIHALGEELVRERHVKLDSFLFDDGWDNPNSVWGFNPDLPDGITRIHEAAKQYGFGIGVWLSPWGGYGQRKKQRVAAGGKAGYEIVNGGFALSGPRYYRHFEKTCLTMIGKFGVNQFKFDGTGNVSTVFPGSIFDSDFSAAIHLIGRLRERAPDVFINLTTGTWPSPFWLRYADSIWRGGDDHSFTGVGSWRQRWITYRDAQTYHNIVEAGPLFPLDSLMLHGIIFGAQAQHLNSDPGGDFADEVHSYFGTGTDLQELYITPSLLSKGDWDVLAEAARWARTNAQVLKDTHWIGGDPAKLEVYGWASWTPAKAILVLRNPSDRAQSYQLDISRAFELPEGAAPGYRAHSPWTSDAGTASIMLRAGEARNVELKPFEVLTLEAVPRK